MGPVLDKCVMDYIEAAGLTGAPVNRRIVLSSALGIVKFRQPGLLKQHGGDLELRETWAVSTLRRANFVKRKGTKAAKKLLPNFPEIKQNFLDRITVLSYQGFSDSCGTGR